MFTPLLRRIIWLLPVYLTGIAAGEGLTQEVPRLQLKVESVISVQGMMGGAILHPIKCDGSGNVYLRFEQPNAFFEPVVKISPKGERLAFFSQESVPGWEKGHMYDFDVGPDGAIHLLVARQIPKTRKVEHAVLTFTERGTHRSTTAIEAKFTSVDRVVAFSTGEFLLVGWRKLEQEGQAREGETSEGASKKEPPVEPVSVILDRGGNVIQEVDFSGPVPSSEGGDTSNGRPTVERTAVAAGVAVSGDDGNIYFMFRDEKPALLVLSATGEIVRVVKVGSPVERAVPLSLKQATGQGLLVHFAEKGPGQSFNTGASIFSLVNPQTGERMADWHSTPGVGGALACYTPGGLIFVGNREGNVAILRVAPR
jgi:hypothetical protein